MKQEVTNKVGNKRIDRCLRNKTFKYLVHHAINYAAKVQNNSNK